MRCFASAQMSHIGNSFEAQASMASRKTDNGAKAANETGYSSAANP